MFGLGKNKIGTESYKGVRDFYPEDQAIQNYIFGVMKKTVESFGYEEYSASILEPLSLYQSKTSEEIVNEQIYSFKDRGNRDVALRPEMTPTVTRMIASKIDELPIPVRWYSIPNLFRYEKPQRGRLREHWQLNVDIFGIPNYLAEAEVIQIASCIMANFGAKEEDFVIKINHKGLLEDIFNKIGIDPSLKDSLFRLIDKKEKMADDDFRKSINDLIGKDKSTSLFKNIYYGEGILSMMRDSKNANDTSFLIKILKERGVKNIEFCPTLTRGFDYYTGIVFEVFDTNKENQRSLFGGGRYDNLLEMFLNKSVPAFGFGMGDVTTRDFLKTHNLLPQIKSSTLLHICRSLDVNIEEIYKIVSVFRRNNINVSVDISDKKIGDQLKTLNKKNIPFVMVIGSEELENNKFVLRNTNTRNEISGDINDVIAFFKDSNYS